MIKVITYGTYDLLHYGHIRLLKRAKALGDYLIVGVTADSFDVARGKINVRQTLMERIEVKRLMTFGVLVWIYLQ
jgi:choline-phosphate cytidylyltransferase